MVVGWADRFWLTQAGVGATNRCNQGGRLPERDRRRGYRREDLLLVVAADLLAHLDVDLVGSFREKGVQTNCAAQ